MFALRRAYFSTQRSLIASYALPKTPSNTSVLRQIHATPVVLKKKSHANKAEQVTKGKQHEPVQESDETTHPKKGKGKPISTADLIPASQSKVAPEARVECDKTDKKMTSCVDWYRKEMALLENRALGRVMPSILDPVRIELPGDEGVNGPVKLTDVATVGVKEGTILVVTVFDEHHLKAVEKAIYAAHIPQCIPQRADARTLRIPMPKPTIEARKAFAKTGSKEAEDTKVKIRSAREVAVKSLSKLGFGRNSPELSELQTLTEKATGEVDKIVQRLKKELGS
ncbi:hypothetical protein FRB99_004705 [Tulasnella sp. 403]|nr:hypothetical protein FRB99_004705 [Tulasnella sp. 403]